MVWCSEQQLRSSAALVEPGHVAAAATAFLGVPIEGFAAMRATPALSVRLRPSGGTNGAQRCQLGNNPVMVGDLVLVERRDPIAFQLLIPGFSLTMVRDWEYDDDVSINTCLYV